MTPRDLPCPCSYQKLRRYVPPRVAWVVRWHSLVPLVNGSLNHMLTRRERRWLRMLRILGEYDHKTKSWIRIPEVNLTQARLLVERLCPKPIQF